MKKAVILILGLFLVLGLQPLCHAQPSIDGDWLFDISGNDQGGAVINFSGGALTGYGFGRDAKAFTLSGQNVVIDSKGKITGEYEACLQNAFDPTLFDDCKGPGTFFGKADKKVTKLSLKFSDGPNAKGIELPSPDPDLPALWQVSGTGQGAGKFTIDTLTVSPLAGDLVFIHRVYTLSGDGTGDDTGDFSVEGVFFLTSKNVAYGTYKAFPRGEPDNPMEVGSFTGKINLSSNKFVFKLTSSEGDKGTMKGVAIPTS